MSRRSGTKSYYKTKNLAADLQAILDAYADEVGETCEEVFEDVVNKTVATLKNTSPKRQGDYAAGWTFDKRGKYTYVVHNKEYRLTHLLNNGHVIANKYGVYGYKEGDGHITEAEQEAINNVIEEMKRKL